MPSAFLFRDDDGYVILFIQPDTLLLIAILVAGGCQTTAWDGSGQFPERHMQPASSYSVSGQSEIVVVYIGFVENWFRILANAFQ